MSLTFLATLGNVKLLAEDTRACLISDEKQVAGYLDASSNANHRIHE